MTDFYPNFFFFHKIKSKSLADSNAQNYLAKNVIPQNWKNFLLVMVK